jgi:uncharacterized protein (DUF1501 family)
MKSRREFLCKCCTSLGAAALTFERFGLVNTFAQPSNYRALVCIFLFGGNDSNNMLIPYDNYGAYAAIRDAASGIKIDKTNATLVRPPSVGGPHFFFHPSMTGIHQLFMQGKVAAVVNVGPLAEPTTRDTYLNGSARVPINLFSHSDQQTSWQTSIATGNSPTGWGGRIIDNTPMLNPVTFPMMVTTSGLSIFTTGDTAALAVSPAPTPLNQSLRLDGFDLSRESLIRRSVLSQLLPLDRGVPLVHSANETMRSALEAAAVLEAAVEPTLRAFPNSSLGNQLKQVAKLIALRDILKVERQIFFCSMGGFDLHTDQFGSHETLLDRLSRAMTAFYNATVDLNVDQQVTTFTLSDFARTFVANGGAGTDHAWGSHQLVMGGPVSVGDFYGTYPRLLVKDGDDADSGAGARGRWIPTTAVDQYGAGLAKWYGVSDGDMPAVFPNLSRFPGGALHFL